MGIESAKAHIAIRVADQERSIKFYNEKVGLAILCPVTTRVKGYPFEVLVPEGLGVKGAILSDQVKSLDWRVRGAEFICKLPESTVDEVIQKLNTLLGQ